MMTTTTNVKTSPKASTKNNGAPENVEQASAHAGPDATSPTPSAPEKKPVTVMLSELLHRKVKITAELSGISVSDLIEAQLKIVVKERLPGLLARLDADS